MIDRTLHVHFMAQMRWPEREWLHLHKSVMLQNLLYFCIMKSPEAPIQQIFPHFPTDTIAQQTTFPQHFAAFGYPKWKFSGVHEKAIGTNVSDKRVFAGRSHLLSELSQNYVLTKIIGFIFALYYFWRPNLRFED